MRYWHDIAGVLFMFDDCIIQTFSGNCWCTQQYTGRNKSRWMEGSTKRRSPNKQFSVALPWQVVIQLENILYLVRQQYSSHQIDLWVKVGCSWITVWLDKINNEVPWPWWQFSSWVCLHFVMVATEINNGVCPFWYGKRHFEVLNWHFKFGFEETFQHLVREDHIAYWTWWIG